MTDGCCHQTPDEDEREAETPGPRPGCIQVPAAPADTPWQCPGPEPPWPADTVPGMACAKVPPQPPAPRQPQPVSAKATTATEASGPARDHCTSADGDLECLVCREPYSYVRPPKLLGCQHSFCAVCLKLLLCVQDNTWSIACPLCRKATAVPGGLICSLRDHEALVGRLVRPCPEVRLCPQGLADPASVATGCPSSVGEDGQDAASANRVAARRLAAHLLLLLGLIILILPFIYPGIVRWVLAVVISLALLMSSLFCCHPSSQSGCRLAPRTLFCRGRKHSEISSIA